MFLLSSTGRSFSTVGDIPSHSRRTPGSSAAKEFRLALGNLRGCLFSAGVCRIYLTCFSRSPVPGHSVPQVDGPRRPGAGGDMWKYLLHEVISLWYEVDGAFEERQDWGPARESATCAVNK